MQNRQLFQRDPTTFSIPNDGVTTVTAPNTPEQWNVLRYELQSFVCEGEYRIGLERILSTYLAQLGESKQPAVWVSGFYGSGKISGPTIIEGLLALYFLSAVVMGIALGKTSFLIYHIMLMIGFGSIFYYTIRHLSHR